MPEISEELRDYIKEGRQFRDTVTAHMAATNTTIAVVTAYIKECNDERKDHDQRLTVLETTNKNRKWVFTAALTSIPVLTAMIEFFKSIKWS